MSPEKHEEYGELLTAREAILTFEKAGLSKATFQRRVNDGHIKKILPKDQKRGALYPKYQVIAATGKKVSQPLLSATLSQALPEDMEDMAPLLVSFYNPKISVTKRAAWIEQNREIAFILRMTDRTAVGCAFVMPLTKEKILEILMKQVKPPTRPSDIPVYTPGLHTPLYLRAIGVTQSTAFSKKQRRHWAAQLIRGIARAIVTLGDRGIFIDAIYAQGDSKVGERVLQRAGFFQIETDTATNRKNYMLDIERSGAPLAMQYKRALANWRALNEEE